MIEKTIKFFNVNIDGLPKKQELYYLLLYKYNSDVALWDGDGFCSTDGHGLYNPIYWAEIPTATSIDK